MHLFKQGHLISLVSFHAEFLFWFFFFFCVSFLVHMVVDSKFACNGCFTVIFIYLFIFIIIIIYLIIYSRNEHCVLIKIILYKTLSIVVCGKAHASAV